MHPALSVIFFTTLSGAGYGLWCLAGLWMLFALPADDVAPFWLLRALLLGAALTATGLTASLAHLGQPQRAWRALTQWKTSWLSREGIAAVVAFVPAAAAFWQLFSLPPEEPWRWHATGAALVLMALVTTYCTGRIYSSLPTIRAWHNRYTVPGYLLLAVYSGALWAWVVAVTPHANVDLRDRLFLHGVVFAGALAGAVFKLLYWRAIDRDAGGPTPESATGLGRYGAVRSFERPHTEENYLTREMGFAVARKHASVLRLVALAAAFMLPSVLALGAVLLPAFDPLFAPLALLSGSAGIFVERWLFFAQARHAVMLYYGAPAAAA